MKIIDQIVEKQRSKHIDIIQVLHEIQNEYNYLPKEALEYFARKTRIPLSRIYSVATFYAAFSLTPRGKHICTVCMGTACHVRGAPNVLSRIEELLGVKAGSTTADNEFTLETVNCLGACALAPIVVVDGKYHGETSISKVEKIIDQYAKKD